MNALPPVIAEHLDEVRALCEKYRVKRLAVFGSAAKGTFDPERSDLDFVVEFDAELFGSAGWHAYFDFKFALSSLFGRNVDLVEHGAVKNPLFREILEETQQDVYAA